MSQKVSKAVHVLHTDSLCQPCYYPHVTEEAPGDNWSAKLTQPVMTAAITIKSFFFPFFFSYFSLFFFLRRGLAMQFRLDLSSLCLVPEHVSSSCRRGALPASPCMDGRGVQFDPCISVHPSGCSSWCPFLFSAYPLLRARVFFVSLSAEVTYYFLSLVKAFSCKK